MTMLIFQSFYESPEHTVLDRDDDTIFVVVNSRGRAMIESISPTRHGAEFWLSNLGGTAVRGGMAEHLIRSQNIFERCQEGWRIVRIRTDIVREEFDDDSDKIYDEPEALDEPPEDFPDTVEE